MEILLHKDNKEIKERAHTHAFLADPLAENHTGLDIKIFTTIKEYVYEYSIQRDTLV